MDWIIYAIGLSLFLAIAYTDCKTQVIPRTLSVPLLGLGLINHVTRIDLFTTISHASAVFICLGLGRHAINWIAKKEAIGFGDVLLVSISTLWFGINHGLFGAYLACCMASVYGISRWILFKPEQIKIPMALFFGLGWSLSWVVYPYLNRYFLF